MLLRSPRRRDLQAPTVRAVVRLAAAQPTITPQCKLATPLVVSDTRPSPTCTAAAAAATDSEDAVNSPLIDDEQRTYTLLLYLNPAIYKR